MQSNKRGLADLVSRIDWVMIENKWGGSVGSLTPDSFKIALEGKSARDTTVNRMIVSIGANILNKLGWQYGDKIAFFHHPDDLCAFRAIRHTTGYKIAKVKNSTIGRIQVRWPHTNLGMSTMRSKEIEYVVHGESLLFIVSQ